MNFDTRIFEAIKGSTPDRPTSLTRILDTVDYYERVILDRRELFDGLQRLIKQGRIGELPDHRYFEGDSLSGRTFSGITIEAYERALRHEPAA